MARSMILALVVGLVGCASNPPSPDGGPARAGGGLQIHIEAVASGWMLHTNRAASVALFEIVPNRGAGLLYPDPSRDGGRVEQGSTRVLTRSGGLIMRHRTAYLTQRGGGGLAGSQALDLMDANSPTLMFAIACECELDLSVVSQADGPADLLGPFASLDAQSAPAKLLSAVLPSPEVEHATSRYFDGG